MAKQGKPPKTYEKFVERFPELGQAWDLIREGESKGLFDERTLRLLKLAVAIGAKSEGTVHSAVRKAVAAGIAPEEIEQVAALSASTIGLPSAVAAFSWAHDVLDKN